MKGKMVVTWTNESINAWVDAAIEDGWEFHSIYHTIDGQETEPKETAGLLSRDGFRIQVWRRPLSVPFSINAYGPDRLAVDIPQHYNKDTMTKLKINLSKCGYCGAIKQGKGQIIRIGFAGRTCKACHAKHVAEVEFHGWAD